MNRYDEVLGKYNLNLQDAIVSKKTSEIIGKIDENNIPEVLKFIHSCIDLTSLKTEDSKESISKLVDEINNFDGTRPDIANVAGVCVYPNFVQTVKDTLQSNVRIVSVAGGFPSAQTFTEVKIAEVSLATVDGADEIDIVFNCGEFLDNNISEICEEIEEIKDACRGAVLKVIIETGLLKTASNIKKAAILSIYSGADFIKTSTGKIYPGATPEAVYVICEAIKEYYSLTGQKIGVKVAGGVSSPEEALKYYLIVKEVLGEAWLSPEYFRIGSSSLNRNILNNL
ncbi:MAG: deoxyribose-phosphate aldolase [Dysgonamonadaceae bacterium]|jgi:deoxyribose-phosphate aldolase|nr:deoxyribose-phosphate aldolase [Dysgonamonadaceae bacterium]